jgi:tetratricopeptide (TPR) repeat protein
MQMLAFRKAEGRDRDRVEQLLKQGMARGASYERSGKPYEAYVRYRVLADGFEGMCDTKAARAAAERLDASDTVRDIRAKKEQEHQRRMELREKFLKRVAAIREDMGDPAKRSKLIRDLKQETQDENEGEVAKRVLEYVMMRYMQEASRAAREKEYEDAAKYMETVCEILPSSGRMLYNLGCAYSLAGDAEKAVDALRRAVENGWKDAAHMEKDPDLKGLRDKPAFREIVSGLKSEGR